MKKCVSICMIDHDVRVCMCVYVYVWPSFDRLPNDSNNQTCHLDLSKSQLELNLNLKLRQERLWIDLIKKKIERTFNIQLMKYTSKVLNIEIVLCWYAWRTSGCMSTPPGINSHTHSHTQTLTHTRNTHTPTHTHTQTKTQKTLIQCGSITEMNRKQECMW